MLENPASLSSFSALVQSPVDNPTIGSRSKCRSLRIELENSSAAEFLVPCKSTITAWIAAACPTLHTHIHSQNTQACVSLRNTIAKKSYEARVVLQLALSW
jgi:hypothetical protein